MCVEVLFADNPASHFQWTLRSFEGPHVDCTVPAPLYDWVNTWLYPPDPAEPLSSAAHPPGTDADSAVRPADWFLDACEALGDAALEQVHCPLGNPRRVRILERCLQVVTDHEILHQELAQSARAVRAG